VSPLPSHFPPHIIYNFCASLHSLTLQIAPPLLKLAGAPAERWALMQKTPTNGQAALIGGDWFTTSVDIRVAEEARKKMKGDQEEEVRSLLEVIAGKGDKLGESTLRIHVKLNGFKVTPPRSRCNQQ